MAIELHRGIVNPDGTLKDGNPNFPYVRDHPTNYRWRPDVKEFILEIVNIPRWVRDLWANTYWHHPPAADPPGSMDVLSWDMWRFPGRGAELTGALHEAVYNFIFNFPDPPDIWWIISNGWMWLRDPDNGFRVSRIFMPQDALDNAHRGHIHTSVFRLAVQRRFRQELAQRRVLLPQDVTEIATFEDHDFENDTRLPTIARQHFAARRRLHREYDISYN